MTEPAEARLVRMAVLSDLHASTDAAAQRSWAIDGNGAAFNPLGGLEKLIDDTPDLRADVLLCPGDLCDQADWDALPYAWEQVQRFGDLLGVEQIVATVGNHDIDSHGKNGEEIDAGLRRLDPVFPCDPGAEAYWRDRVAHLRGEDWQVVTLNSSLMRELAGDEHDRGEVHDVTLELINEITRGETLPVNILLCHHHPQPFTRLAPADASHMVAGDRLVELLDRMPEVWMIVHGHKHQPHLDYMEGTAASPTRLVAGSAGVILWPMLSSHVRNQLHLLEFPIDEAVSLDLGLAGRVRSWSWQAVTQWIPARAEGDGLPGVAGFGYRTDGPSLARGLVRMATEAHIGVVERQQLRDWQPRLPFLLPADLAAFRRHLEADLGCHLRLDSQGEIEQVVMPGG